MKHLKTIRIFESSEREEDIKDICLELEDDGFSVTYNSALGPIKAIGIKLQHHSSHNGNTDNTFFDYEQVKEVVDRIMLYLGDKFVSLYIVDHNQQLCKLQVEKGVHFTCGFGNKPIRVNLVIIKYKDI
jgi:hypothetical protein